MQEKETYLGQNSSCLGRLPWYMSSPLEVRSSR